MLPAIYTVLYMASNAIKKNRETFLILTILSDKFNRAKIKTIKIIFYNMVGYIFVIVTVIHGSNLYFQ